MIVKSVFWFGRLVNFQKFWNVIYVNIQYNPRKRFFSYKVLEKTLLFKQFFIVRIYFIFSDILNYCVLDITRRRMQYDFFLIFN